MRLRILQTFIGGQKLTPNQLRASMPDVPPATLYRHVNALTRGGVLRVADRRQVRGAVEKLYELIEEEAHLSAEDVAHASRADHRDYFTTFLFSLLGEFERYLRGGRIDLAADGVSYRQVALHLTDEEFAVLIQSIRSPLKAALANQPAPDRRRRLLSIISIPEPNPADPKDGEA